jgi:hypothetical protein
MGYNSHQRLNGCQAHRNLAWVQRTLKNPRCERHRGTVPQVYQSHCPKRAASRMP